MSMLLRHLGQFMQRRSLATRLIVLILVVSILAITTLFYDLSRQNQREIETLQTNNLVNAAQELARNLDAVVQSETSRIANLALSRAVQEFVGARPDQRSALFTPTLTDFTNFLDSSPAYRAVLLLDDSGEVLISTQGSYVGQNFENSDFFKEVRQNQVYMSNPGLSSLDRQAVIWVAAPVYTDNPHSPAGVVVVTLSPELLWNPVERLAIGEHGYAILIDQYGIRLAHGRDRAYIFRSLAPLSPSVWGELQASNRFGPLPKILDTGSIALWDYVQSDPLPDLLINALDEQQQSVYYSAAPLETRNWTVVAMLPEAEVLAPANRVTSHGMGAAILLTVLLGITVVWMAHRIMQPVPQLVKATSKIAQGDLSTPITVDGVAELRILADSFESMRRNLQDSQDELAHWARTLEARVAQRTQELAALSEVVAFASLSQSGPQLMDTALEQSLKAMNAEMGGIWIADPYDGTVHLQAYRGLDDELIEGLTTFASGEGLIGRVQATGEPVVLDDLSEAPRLARAVVQERLIRAFVAVPLRIHGQNLGVLAVFSQVQQYFSPEVVLLAASIARQIALTLDNLNLVEQVQHQTHSVARLQERERIGAEIHDSTAQTLSYLYLQADQLADDALMIPPKAVKSRLLNLREVIDGLTTETRQLIAQLRDVSPPPPANLENIIRTELDKLSDELKLDVRLDLQQASALAIPSETGTELTRIVGEALRNAQKHGHADTAWLKFQRENGTALLSVQDNGSGFTPGQSPDDNRHHFGLSVMEARATRIGGRLKINSEPGQGTRIEIIWPVNGNFKK
ncbi:MAG: GAF domain-containing protein [Anaerolineae bacterium]|nr:GAF domain-containing protein [Anaerolineae bacterium]